MFNGSPCKVEKHTRILSKCEYDIIFVLEYLNLKIFAEKNQPFLSLYFLQAQSLVAISLVLKLSPRFFPSKHIYCFSETDLFKICFLLFCTYDCHQYWNTLELCTNHSIISELLMLQLDTYLGKKVNAAEQKLWNFKLALQWTKWVIQ